MNQIVPKIARIDITTISSTRVKALLLNSFIKKFTNINNIHIIYMLLFNKKKIILFIYLIFNYFIKYKKTPTMLSHNQSFFYY